MRGIVRVVVLLSKKPHHHLLRKWSPSPAEVERRLNDAYDQKAETLAVSPSAVLLFRCEAEPLPMTLDESNYDRLAELADRLDVLIEQGYTIQEIRTHLDKIDAANGEVA